MYNGQVTNVNLHLTSVLNYTNPHIAEINSETKKLHMNYNQEVTAWIFTKTVYPIKQH